MFDYRNMIILTLSTINFKNEEVACAKILFEVFDDGAWFLWNIAFTSCDPFCFGNFTAPLGLDPHSLRGTYNGATQKIRLLNELPPIEYEVFLYQKIKFLKKRMFDKLSKDPSFVYDLRQLALTSRRMNSATLREIVGHAFSSHVSTAEKYCSLFYGDAVTPEQRKFAEQEELRRLREVVEGFSALDFYDLYVAQLDRQLLVPIDLHPAKYKTEGGKLLMFEDDLAIWDRIVFLLMLGARADLVAYSPYEFSLGLGSGSVGFCEVSPDDARFAEKTPALPECSHKVKLGDLPDEYLVLMSEGVVFSQENFMQDLADYIAADDIDGAFDKLTNGTAEPKNGQGLLGLSIALLRALTTGEIVFPKALTDKIVETMSSYGIKWCLPLLQIDVDPAGDSTHVQSLIRMIGVPVCL